MSYAIRCYGFNDGFWGTQRFAGFSAAAPSGVTDEGEEYTLGFSGINWFGPAPSSESEAEAGLQGNIAYYDARFAGMIVEVTITYED